MSALFRKALAMFLPLLALSACEEEGAPTTAPPALPVHTKIQVEGASLEFDPATVMRGSAGFGWGLGSVKVFVLGREGGQCVFDLLNEIEGGYTNYRCRVPVDGPPVRIYEDNGGIQTSFDLENAKVTFGGNVHFELGRDDPSGLEWEGRSVEDSGYVVYFADKIRSEGSIAKEGKRLTLHVTLFASERGQTPLVGFESGRTMEIVLGEGPSESGLETAVRGMKVGGRRLARIREEAAGQLGEIFGPFNPGTLLVLELELKKVE